MVSTRKKKQSNRRLLSQLDDFDRDVIIGNAVSERQENIVVNEGVSNVNDETRHNIPDKVVNCRSQKHTLTGNDTLITW